ncbi:MAG TPA: 5'-methylthioadenosine/S-adenosylhomocysteine nucleosidase [Patescibacteria group bacterium]|nr:5'-methylthioadenosine/S-adenosylhomocysteine nucleosidase [Patescibacteria group bacterium]
MNTLFLLAMGYEISHIFNLVDWNVSQEKPFPVYTHKTLPFTIVQTGVGKVNAAAATQFALSHYPTERIVNLGAVGCMNKKIAIGEVRQISECTFFDVDCTAFNYKLGQIPKCDIASYPLHTTGDIPVAKLVTGDSFISDQSKLQAISDIFSPDFIDMELAAIAHTLYINDKLSLLESFKAPSDYANASSSQDFYDNEKLAFSHLQALAALLLTEKK